MYCAIIGDIINSRSIENRNSIQNKLNNILNDINNKYHNNIAAKFVITIGDEFQGLLNNPENLMKIIDEIKENLHPIKFRIGIGIGNIDTKINPNMALGADGPAYHYAREALSKIKELVNQYESSKQDSMIIYYPNNKSYSLAKNLINAILSAIYLIENNWSEKQREAVYLVQKEEKSQRNFANELNIGQSSLQRRLYAANYSTYNKLKKEIHEAINQIWSCLYAV